MKKTQARCLCHSYGKADGAVVLNVLCLVIPCVCFDDCGRPLNAIGNMGREDLGKAAAKERERCTWQRDNSHMLQTRGACHVSSFPPVF